MRSRRELKTKLKYADYGTVSEIINDYEEYFAHGLLEGKTEEEICMEIGTPQQIIDNLIEQGVLKGPHYMKQKTYKETISGGSNEYNIVGIIGLVILNFFLISVILVPAGGAILGVGVGFIVAVIPAIIASIYLLVLGLIYPFFAVITSVAFMILVVIGIYFLIKNLIPLGKKYVLWNIKVARG